MKATFFAALIALTSTVPAIGEDTGMAKTAQEKTKSGAPKGWMYCAEHESDYEVAIVPEKHSGTRCATLRSIVDKPRPFGNLMQYIDAKNYVGKRLKMSAWVKSKIESGTGQLWLRIDGDWDASSEENGCFDNMDDRPIKGTTDWKKYDLVVQLPAKSTGIAFGMMLIGKGQLWLDDVSVEEVSPDVPLTGKYVHGTNYSTTPVNLNFEESD